MIRSNKKKVKFQKKDEKLNNYFKSERILPDRLIKAHLNVSHEYTNYNNNYWDKKYSC